MELFIFFPKEIDLRNQFIDCTVYEIIKALSCQNLPIGMVQPTQK